LSYADHLYIFFGICWVIPMTDNMKPLGIGIYPAVPHNLVCIKRIFRDTHRIHLAASSVIFFASIMGIGIRENNIYSAGAYSFSGTRTNLPVFPPPPNGFHGVLILVSVIITSIVTFIQRPLAFLMEGICIFIPIFPDRKSTRLNSSHVKISYAVFCLKKKI